MHSPVIISHQQHAFYIKKIQFYDHPEIRMQRTSEIYLPQGPAIPKSRAVTKHTIHRAIKLFRSPIIISTTIIFC